MPHLYKRWMLSLASAIACTGFAFLNRGGLVECLVVFIAAGAGQFLRSTLMKRGTSHMAIWMACGFLGAGTYIGIIRLLVALNLVGSDHIGGVHRPQFRVSWSPGIPYGDRHGSDISRYGLSWPVFHA